jgi:hypothetical protein
LPHAARANASLTTFGFVNTDASLFGAAHSSGGQPPPPSRNTEAVRLGLLAPARIWRLSWLMRPHESVTTFPGTQANKKLVLASRHI